MTQTRASATTTPGENRPISERVVEAVANAAGTSELELQPLYEVVDPDALESLFHAGSDGTVRFTYHGHHVVVSSDGDVDVDVDEQF